MKNMILKKTLIFRWVLCSLTENCMNPPGSQVKCIFERNWCKYQANCFRYDQSVLNLLLLNNFSEIHKYYSAKLSSSFIRNDWLNIFGDSINYTILLSKSWKFENLIVLNKTCISVEIFKNVLNMTTKSAEWRIFELKKTYFCWILQFLKTFLCKLAYFAYFFLKRNYNSEQICYNFQPQIYDLPLR